jgi:hypothetical protein
MNRIGLTPRRPYASDMPARSSIPMRTHTPLRVSPRIAALALAGVAAALPACRAGGFENENDRLRYRVQELETDLARATAERRELEAKLAERTAELNATQPDAAGELIAAIPRVAGVGIDRLSSLVDRDAEPGFESIDVYIRPFDGRQRFVQAVGTLRVQALRLNPPPAADAANADDADDAPAGGELLAQATLGPRDLRDAYRSTLLSTHYSVELRLNPPIPQDPAAGPVLITVQFRDAITGLTHTATRQLITR